MLHGRNVIERNDHMPSRRRFIGTGAAGLALAGIAARAHGGLAQEATSTATAEGAQGTTAPVVGTPTLNPAIGLIEAQDCP
jgi:nitrous oxide reductase